MINRSLSPGNQKCPWQGSLLAWLSVTGVAMILSVTVFIFILSYSGFDAGEMGFMIGVFAAVGLFFLIPWLIIKLVLTIGIFRGKKWAVLISLIFTIAGFIPGFFTIGAGLIAFLLSIGFLALMLWAEIRCMKHPYYNNEAERKEEKRQESRTMK